MKALTIALLFCIIALGGCASPVIERSQPAPPSVESAQPGKALVFGKVDLFMDGIPQDRIGKLGWSGSTHFSALIVADGAKQAIAQHTDEQGWFSWALAPGDYMFLGFIVGDGVTGSVNARFSVDANDRVVYIGHVRIDVRQTGFAVGLWDAEQDAQAALQKGGRGDAGPAAKRLMKSEAKVGQYSAINSACSRQWALDCTRELQGVAPIHPAIERGPTGIGFTPINELKPTLRWAAHRSGDVSYDIAVWEAAHHQWAIARRIHLPNRLVVYAENLKASEFALQDALKPKTQYLWSVRLRQGDVVSSWSHAGHFAFLLVVSTSSRGQWFGFETR